MVQFGDNIKFYYVDSDGDIISITNQGDLQEAYEVLNGQVRLVVAKNLDEAKQIIGESSVNRSEILNQSMHMQQPTAPPQQPAGVGQFQ